MGDKVAAAAVVVAVGDFLGDFGDFFTTSLSDGSLGMSTWSGLFVSNANDVLSSALSMAGLRSGLLPNVKLFTARGFDVNLNDENFSEARKGFELSVDS